MACTRESMRITVRHEQFLRAAAYLPEPGDIEFTTVPNPGCKIKKGKIAEHFLGHRESFKITGTLDFWFPRFSNFSRHCAQEYVRSEPN
jgi:hypothetical protein